VKVKYFEKLNWKHASDLGIVLQQIFRVDFGTAVYHLMGESIMTSFPRDPGHFPFFLGNPIA